MSSACVKAWVKIPKLDTVCVQRSATISIEEHNKAHPDHKLTYNKILEGWFLEMVSDQVKVRLLMAVKDCKGCELFYEAVLIERGASKQVISFNPVYRDSEGKFWIQISKIDDPPVQEVAKYVVEEISKKLGDKFHYVCTIEAWYLESGPSGGTYRICIEVKDSRGFEFTYEITVSVSGKSKNVISFHLVRRDPEGKFLIKISKIDDPPVQEVAKYVVEEISKKIGDKLHYLCTIEGWCSELRPTHGKYCMYILVKDSKGFEVSYEITVSVSGKSKNVISFHPVRRDPEGKFLIKISKIDDPPVQEVAKYVVEEISKKIGDKLHYLCTIEGWCSELRPTHGKYCMYILVKDSKGFEVSYEITVSVSGKSKNVISFHPVRRDPEGKFLIKISKIDDPPVQEVAKYVVEEISKKIGDKLHYLCTIEGWCSELRPTHGKYCMYILVKDSKGFEVSYEITVSVSGKSKNVISFHPVRRDPEGKFLIKISKIDDPPVQEVAKYVVEEISKKIGDKLHYLCTIEGWCSELRPTHGKYCMYILVKDSKGFEVSYEITVSVSGKSKNVISFHPVRRDPEGKFWIKISKINDPSVLVVANFAVEENNKKNGDELYYKSTVEGWYLKVDQVTSQLYWLHVEVKDCLGRVRKFKTIVKEEKKGTLKVLTLQYFGLIKG